MTDQHQSSAQAIEQQQSPDDQETIARFFEETAISSRARLAYVVVIACPSCGKPVGEPCSAHALDEYLDGVWSVCGKRMAKVLGREDLYWIFDGGRVLRLPDEEWKDENRRSVLPLNNCGAPADVGRTVMIRSTTGGGAFRPQRLFMSVHCKGWTIQDVTIANKSQFRHGPASVPAELFSSDVLGHGVWLDDVDTAMEVVIVASRDSDEAAPALIGSMLGLGCKDRRQLTASIPAS